MATDENFTGADAQQAPVPLSKVALSCLSILSVATAVIHFAVAGAHFQRYWLLGVFMLVVAWLHLLWGVLAISRPARWLLRSGIALTLVVTAEPDRLDRARSGADNVPR